MKTIIIGDVHGCAREFEAIVHKCSFKRGTDRLLLTGDAFTRGPDPRGVWNLINDHEANMVLGNHDVHLIRELEGDPCDPRFVRLHAGLREQVRPEFLERAASQLRPVAVQLLAWLKNRCLYISDERYVLVHAGVDPERGLAGTSDTQFLEIRAWPPQENFSPTTRRWWEGFQPDNGRLLVFGHDAQRGLVVRRQAETAPPYLIGLDSGCYNFYEARGRLRAEARLSAYIIEDDTFVHVRPN